MNKRIDLLREMVNEINTHNGRLSEFNYHKMENVNDILKYEHKGKDFNSKDEYFIANKDRTASSMKTQELEQILVANSGEILYEVKRILREPSTSLYVSARLGTLVRLLFKGIDMRSQEEKDQEEIESQQI